MEAAAFKHRSPNSSIWQLFPMCVCVGSCSSHLYYMSLACQPRDMQALLRDHNGMTPQRATNKHLPHKQPKCCSEMIQAAAHTFHSAILYLTQWKALKRVILAFLSAKISLLYFWCMRTIAPLATALTSSTSFEATYPAERRLILCWLRQLSLGFKAVVVSELTWTVNIGRLVRMAHGASSHWIQPQHAAKSIGTIHLWHHQWR